MDIDGAICSKVIKHFADLNEPILSVHDSYVCGEHFKDELIEVMNEIISDPLQGYLVGIKANKELQDYSQYKEQGVINLGQVMDPYLDGPKDESRCEEYCNRLDKYREWLYLEDQSIQ